MPIDYGKIVGDLKDAVLGTVKEASQDFLAKHQDAKDFLEAQAKDLESLGLEYVKASDDAARAKIELQLKLVTQSVRNKLAGIALDAEVEAKATFGKILETALNIAVKVLPVVLSAV